MLISSWFYTCDCFITDEPCLNKYAGLGTTMSHLSVDANPSYMMSRSPSPFCSSDSECYDDVLTNGDDDDGVCDNCDDGHVNDDDIYGHYDDKDVNGDVDDAYENDNDDEIYINDADDEIYVDDDDIEQQFLLQSNVPVPSLRRNLNQKPPTPPPRENKYKYQCVVTEHDDVEYEYIST